MKYDTLVTYLNKSNTEYDFNVKTSSLVSFKIGGSAEIVVYPRSEDAFCNILSISKEKGYKFTVLGKGTNSYFCDGIYGGLVLVTTGLNQIYIKGCALCAMCGASISECTKIALQNSLEGMEFAYGIPGSVAGSVYMNASAFGGSISDILYKSKVFDINSGKTFYLSLDEHNYTPKHSSFSDNKNLFILESEFRLAYGNKESIRQRMSTFLLRRKETQPLDYPSAGSAFKRPLNAYASKLIDEAGLKGFSIGGVQISPKHAGFIINTGNATAKDLRELIEIIKNTVKKKTGILLEEEIIYME